MPRKVTPISNEDLALVYSKVLFLKLRKGLLTEHLLIFVASSIMYRCQTEVHLFHDGGSAFVLLNAPRLCACVHNENLERFYQDDEIDDDRTCIEVVHIKLHALLVRDMLASANLPESGDTRPYR